MDSIRKTIEYLFCHKNPTEILNGIGHLSNREKVEYALCHMDLYYAGMYGTNDQNDIVLKLFTSKWSKADDTLSNNLAFFVSSTVFNVLLHYVGQTLEYDNNSRVPIVKFNELLRWQDLVVNIGEDLPVSIFLASWHMRRGTVQQCFDWKPFIDTDNYDLVSIFNRGLADIHHHLKGSSSIFDLNWMSLMNHISNRLSQFKRLRFRLNDKVDGNINFIKAPLYINVVKACAIRLWLFESVMASEEILIPKKLLWDILFCENELQMSHFALLLQNSINVARELYGKKFTDIYESKSDIPDYSISGCDHSIYAVLGGERRLLYDVFTLLLSGNEVYSFMPDLLHCYLIIKNQLRAEIIQVNSQIGFDNFRNYQDRKELFIVKGSVYDHLLAPLAVIGYFSEGEERYVETRIAPKDTLKALCLSLYNIKDDILNPQFVDSSNRYTNKYHFVLHFIKCKEKCNKNNAEFEPRNFNVRKNVERQARSLFLLRNMNNTLAHNIVGIDAANSEIYCRPEVFAQAFRFLRNHEISETVIERPANLGMTYHVGEDFYDIVDGLRAIDEVLLYLNFRNGDRLGHALVLGIDVEKYYIQRDYTLSMTKQTLLDNLCWMYSRCLQIFGLVQPCEYIKSLFDKYSQEIYGESIDIHSYFHSWLLRGDSPEMYKDPSFSKNLRWCVDPWMRSALNMENQAVIEAREDYVAMKLYQKYHFDSNVKRIGSAGEIVQIPYCERKAFINLVFELQQYMLNKVSELGLKIECNPSSNYKIGEICRYDQHPILHFYNVGIVKDKEMRIPVSINTDDRGIFATSLEREYSLIALALTKNYLDSGQQCIYEWLENIRKMGWNHRFWHQP